MIRSSCHPQLLPLMALINAHSLAKAAIFSYAHGILYYRPSHGASMGQIGDLFQKLLIPLGVSHFSSSLSLQIFAAVVGSRNLDKFLLLHLE